MNIVTLFWTCHGTLVVYGNFFRIDSGAVLKILTNSKSLFDDEEKHASNWIFSSKTQTTAPTISKVQLFLLKNTFYRGTPRIFFLFLGCLFNDDTRFELMIWKKSTEKNLKMMDHGFFLNFCLSFCWNGSNRGHISVRQFQFK